MVPVDVVSGRLMRSTMITFLCMLLIGALIVIAFILIYSDSTRKVLRAEEAARKAAENANQSDVYKRQARRGRIRSFMKIWPKAGMIWWYPNSA